MWKAVSISQGPTHFVLWLCGLRDALPSPDVFFPLIPVLAYARPILAPPPCRCLTAAPGSLAHCASRARGVWVGCAQATDSARTGSWAVGSAAAARASMERPVRCVSWAAMGPTALEVRTEEGAGMVGTLAEDSGRGDTPAGAGRRQWVTPVLLCLLPVCHCVHGLCQEGLRGDGSCVCNVGWQGLRCDQSKCPQRGGRGLPGRWFLGLTDQNHPILLPLRNHWPSLHKEV